MNEAISALLSDNDRFILLLADPTLPNAITSDGNSLLQIAVMNGKLSAVKSLLRIPGINLHHRNSNGKTAESLCDIVNGTNKKYMPFISKAIKTALTQIKQQQPTATSTIYPGVYTTAFFEPPPHSSPILASQSSSSPSQAQAAPQVSATAPDTKLTSGERLPDSDLNAIINAATDSISFAKAEEIFTEAREDGGVYTNNYNNMISAAGICGNFNKAYKYYLLTRTDRMEDTITFTNMITVAGNLGKFDIAKMVYEAVRKTSFLDKTVFISMMTAAGNCGNLPEAANVYEHAHSAKLQYDEEVHEAFAAASQRCDELARSRAPERLPSQAVTPSFWGGAGSLHQGRSSEWQLPSFNPFG